MTISADVPAVTIGEITYQVFPVAFREVSKILPLANKVFSGMRANDLSEEVLEGLGKIIFYGIKKGMPDLTYEDFIDRPATTAEMMAAAITVCAQAGLKAKDAAPGEATGETLPQTSKS